MEPTEDDHMVDACEGFDPGKRHSSITFGRAINNTPKWLLLPRKFHAVCPNRAFAGAKAVHKAAKGVAARISQSTRPPKAGQVRHHLRFQEGRTEGGGSQGTGDVGAQRRAMGRLE